MLRQPVPGKPGAGEPFCSCHRSPVDMGHMQLGALGKGEVRWRDVAANRAEGPSLCPCSGGFADQCVHPTHAKPPLWPQPWCLAPLRVIPPHLAVWGSTRPLWLGTVFSIPRFSCPWAMGLFMPVKILPPLQSKAFLQPCCHLICSPFSPLSFLQLSEIGTLFEKQEVQKEAVWPRQCHVRQNKNSWGGASERFWKKLEHTCSSSPSVFVTSL